MRDEWSLIEYRFPDSPEPKLFRKNMQPIVKPGSLSHPFLCFLTFEYTIIGTSALPSTEDGNLLVDIEEKEIFSFENETGAILVGVVLGGGIKDFIFYSKTEQQFNDWASKMKNSYPEFEINFLVNKDPEWSQYNQLPPEDDNKH